MDTRKMQQYIVKGKEVFIGLEIAKRTWKVCARCEGMEVHSTSMPAGYATLRSFFSNRFPACSITVLYEAGFSGFTLRDQLVADGIACDVIPPHLVTEPKVNRVKTDSRDARRLAKILETRDYRACDVPDAERRADRQVVRTLMAIQKEIVATRNRIIKTLDFHGIAHSLPTGAWGKKHLSLLRSLVADSPIVLPQEVLIDLLEHLWTAREKLRSALRALTKKERYREAHKLICTIPGIGWFTAIRLILELGENLSRFTRANSIASFVGLTCAEYSTGDTVRRGRITGQGSRHIRSWLIESAWVSIRKDPALLEKFRRVWRNSGSKKKAIVAVARMLITRLRTCVITQQPYVIGVVG
jgi:transposase